MDDRGFIYVYRRGDGLIGIGRTRNLRQRMRARYYEARSYGGLTLIMVGIAKNATDVERALHDQFNHARVKRREFRRPTPRVYGVPRELFRLSTGDLIDLASALQSMTEVIS